MPPEQNWQDVVRVDRNKRCRTVVGGNVISTTETEKLVIRARIDEKSSYSASLNSTGLESTLFTRAVEIEVEGIPEYFTSSCLQLYSRSTTRMRQEEDTAIRASICARALTVGNACSSNSSSSSRVATANSDKVHSATLFVGLRRGLLNLFVEGGGSLSSGNGHHQGLPITPRGCVVRWGIALVLAIIFCCCSDWLYVEDTSSYDL